MKKIFVSLFAAAAVLAACSEQPEAVTPATVSIEPVITRALSLNFKTGNKIGLDIIKSDETLHAENACLTYDGTTFNSDLMWYAEGGENCSLVAYYPYQEDGLPASFTVAADQSAGTDASDFMIATKTGVRPSYSPVVMQFKHIFSQVSIKVDNKADVPLENVTVRGLIPTATITKAEDGTYTVAADASAEAAAILAEKLVDNKEYCAVVVPQAFTSMDVVLGIKDASAVVTNIDAAELKAGYSYTINLVISTDGVSATLGGEIENWKDGGELGGEVQAPAEFEEFDGYFIYHGKRYNTVTLSNGTTWMAEPLAYLPEGETASSDPSTGTIFYPFSSDGSQATPLTDESSIKALGYLYTANAAYNTADITAENWTNFEGVQGICPTGWHIPSRADYYALCGSSNANSLMNETGNQTDANALFYDTALSGGSIVKFNEAGFNYTMAGCVYNGSYRTNIVAENTAPADSYIGKLSMNYSWTSTAQKLNTSNAPQFFVCMTTFTTSMKGKVTLSQTVAGTGATVRCVKNN